MVGAAFIFIFSVWSLGLTVGGFVPFAEDPVTNLKAMALPAITLAVFSESPEPLRRLAQTYFQIAQTCGYRTEHCWYLAKREAVRGMPSESSHT